MPTITDQPGNRHFLEPLQVEFFPEQFNGKGAVRGDGFVVGQKTHPGDFYGQIVALVVQPVIQGRRCLADLDLLVCKPAEHRQIPVER